MDEQYIEKCLLLLRESVWLASRPAEEQLAELPNGCDKPYEIAAEVENWTRWALKRPELQLTRDQRDSLENLDSLFDHMSGAENKGLWSEQAVRLNPKWEETRRRARKVLVAFGWNDERLSSFRF